MSIITKEQFNLLNKPLDAIDEYLTILAKDRNFDICKNYHSWPNRSLKWLTNDGVNRKIEISIEDNLKTFRIIGYAWYDFRGERFAKITPFINSIQPPLQTTLEIIVPKYIDKLNAINKEDLKLAKA